jgi:biopolymer transport protein ExbD
MMSTKFIDEGRLQVRLPDAGVQADESTSDKSVEIEVTAEGGYRLDGRDLLNNSPDTLATALSRATGGNRALPITIRADARDASIRGHCHGRCGSPWYRQLQYRHGTRWV